MRVNALLATFMVLIVMFSTAQMNDFKTQEVEDDQFLSASSKNSTISKTVDPNSGSTDGGEVITITGSGFLDLAYENVTSDGEAYTWTTTTANYVTSSGYDPSIGVDSNGTVHIVHVILDSDELWHSSYDGSTWSHAKIRNCDCRNIDLVIDSNDNVHIAHYNNGYLLYSMYDGTSWTNNWSKSGVENDQISIALDANDQPHISYSRDGYICNAALLSYYDGTSWITVTLDDTTTYIGCDSSIAIDSNGFVHVAYRHHGNMDMKIASNISGSWQRYTVDNGAGVGYHSAMAVDSNDELHLVYASNAAGNTAYFADGASGSAWTVSSQGTSRNTFSMYIDQFDIVHISEYNGNSNLGYSMVMPGGSRQSMNVDGVGDVGSENDIFVDDDNMVHMAYYDSSNKRLKYANRSTGMIQTHEVRVDFGSYGSVIGTVVNDTTIVLTTPPNNLVQLRVQSLLPFGMLMGLSTKSTTHSDSTSRTTLTAMASMMNTTIALSLLVQSQTMQLVAQMLTAMATATVSMCSQTMPHNGWTPMAMAMATIRTKTTGMPFHSIQVNGMTLTWMATVITHLGISPMTARLWPETPPWML